MSCGGAAGMTVLALAPPHTGDLTAAEHFLNDPDTTNPAATSKPTADRSAS